MNEFTFSSVSKEIKGKREPYRVKTVDFFAM